MLGYLSPKLLPLVVCIAFTHQLHAADDGRRLIELWDNSAQSIWSYDVTVHATVRSFSKEQKALVAVGDYVLQQRFMQASWRVDRIRTEQFTKEGKPERWKRDDDQIHAFAFDFGTRKVKFFDSGQNFGQLQSGSQSVRAKLLVPQLYEFFRSDFHGQTFHDMLLSRSDHAKVSTNGNFVTLTIPPAADSSLKVMYPKDWFEVVLDTTKGHVPVRLKIAADLKSEESSSTRENEWTQIDGVLWIPAKSILTVRSKKFTDGSDVPASVTTVEVDIPKSKFNVDISSKVFDLPFPPGTLVRDEDKKQNFVQTSGDKKDYKAYNKYVRSLAHKPPQPSKQRQPTAVTPEPDRGGRWAVIGFLLFVIMLLFYVLWRRQRRQ